MSWYSFAKNSREKLVKGKKFKKMKKVLFILVAMVTVGFGSVATAQEAIKFGYVSSDSVMLALPEYKTQMKIYESYGKQLEAQMKGKQQEFQTKLQDFQQNNANWIPEVIQDKQQELQRLDTSLQEFAQTAQNNLAKKEQELLFPLYEKVQTGIDDVAKEQGFTFVLQKQMFLYANEKYDITELVIKKLGGSTAPAE